MRLRPDRPVLAGVLVHHAPREREQSFAKLRADRPISWHPPVEDSLMPDPDDPGYWAVTRHADIVAVSRNSESFLSGKGVLFENVPEELLEASQSFLAMDPPRHTPDPQGRPVAAFTPRQVRRIEDSIKANATTIVYGAARRRKRASISSTTAPRNCRCARCRTWSGIPESERHQVARRRRRHGLAGATRSTSTVETRWRCWSQARCTCIRWPGCSPPNVARASRATTCSAAWCTAEVDGARLTDAEVAAFFVLLAVAGNDTTRQTTSHAMKALTDFPDQRAWLTDAFDERIGVAVEEFVRWATPVMTFRRTAATDYELGGQHIRAGEKVVMFYSSGN